MNDGKEAFVISLRDNSSTFQMYIHDKNEYARGHNYLNHVSLDSFESKYIYLKISRMEMASDCEKSESYSFNKCVENHVIKVLEIFSPQKNFSFHSFAGCGMQSHVVRL